MNAQSPAGQKLSDTAGLNFRSALRHVVQQWECDHQGHWNVRSYMGWMADALYSLAAELGFDESTAGASGLGFAGVHAEMDFLREVLPGDVIEVWAAIESLGAKRVTLRHRFQRVGDGAIVMFSRLSAVCLDRRARRAAPFPPEIYERLKALAPVQAQQA